MRCQLHNGFLIVRRCTNAAATTCPSCRRAVCPAHLAPDGRCMVCAAKNAHFQPTDPHHLMHHNAVSYHYASRSNRHDHDLDDVIEDLAGEDWEEGGGDEGDWGDS